MTDKEKLKQIKKLADAMYDAARFMTTDASRLHKAMDEYHQFVINEYHKEEPVSKQSVDEAMTEIEKIKHYIENLIESNKGKSYSEPFLGALYTVLGFINSMKEEPATKDYRERYKRIAESEQFKKTHEGMSVGDVMRIESLHQEV